MVVSTEFRDFTSGRGRETSGLLLHRGAFLVRGSGGDNLSVTGSQTLVTAPTARVIVSGGTDGTLWTDSHLRLDQAAPATPRVGFHESGSSALALYKPTGSNNQLRIRGNDGTDYALVGAPGSAQQLLGSWYATSAWALPQTAVWTETEIKFTYTSGAGLLRFEFQVTVDCPSPPLAPIYLGLGLDGALTWPSMAIYTPPGPGYVSALSGRMYYQPPSAGTHRVGVFMYGNAGARFTSSAYSGLWVTEQKA